MCGRESIGTRHKNRNLIQIFTRHRQIENIPEVKYMADFHENVIEWYTEEKNVSVTVHQGKHKSQLLRLAEKYPDEVQILAHNEDGSIFAHVPKRYINIRRPREMTEEQRIANAERLRKNRLK